MTRPERTGSMTDRSEPTTAAGRALVEWAQIAAPNQVDVWREHAVLIESEAYGLGIRMVKPDIEAQEALYTAERVTHAYQQGRRDIAALPPSDPPTLDDVRHALKYINVALDKASYGDAVEGDLLEAHATLDSLIARLSAQPEPAA